MTTPQSRLLLSLPAEIVELILDNVSPSVLSAIRQTCRTLSQLAEKHFGLKVLTEKHIVLTKPALEGVIALLQHKVFGLCVQKLMFSCQRVEERVTILMQKSTEQGVESKHQISGMLKAYEDASAPQRRFLASGDAVKLLAKIFGILKSRGQKVEFGVYDGSRGYGYAEAFAGLGLEAWYARPGSTLQLVINATVASRYRPNNLTIDLQDWNQGNSTDNQRFADLIGRLTAAGTAGRISGGLHFHLAVGGKRLILDSTNSKIELSSSDTKQKPPLFEKHTLGFLVRRVFQAEVRMLYLHDIKISWKDVNTLLQIRGTNITELEIRGVEFIRAAGEEMKLPELIKTHLPFEKVVLEDISCVAPASTAVWEDEMDGQDDITVSAADEIDQAANEGGSADETNEFTQTAPPSAILVSGRHEWNGKAQVLRGLDDMIEKRDRASREDDERLMMDLRLQLALSVLDEDSEEEKIGSHELV